MGRSWLVFMFIGMPLLELFLLIRLHVWIGWGDTLLVVILTGVIGAILVRAQGARLVATIRWELEAGRIPAPHILDGVLLLLAGAFLITPGLLTDAAGFLLLIPALRGRLRGVVIRRLQRGFAGGRAGIRFWRG